MSANRVILVGNVGTDPEVKYLNEDTPVAKFSLATSESYKNKNGEKVDETTWHNIVIWRGLAKVVEQWVKKGQMLYLEGKIKNRSWDDKDGIKRYITEIVCDNMQMIGKRPESTPQPEQPNQPEPNSIVDLPNGIDQDAGDLRPDEPDDLPF